MPDVNWLNGGIVRSGAYVPRYRLSTELISKEWGGSGTTQKSVANIDEDATSMKTQLHLASKPPGELLLATIAKSIAYFLEVSPSLTLQKRVSSRFRSP